MDDGCSGGVRTAIQSLHRSGQLRVCDVGAVVASTPAALASTRAVLLALRNRHGIPAVGVIARLRMVAPHVGVFVIEDRRQSLDSWLPRLAAAGADDVFALDRIGDDTLLHVVLATRLALAPPELALRQLQSLWGSSPLRDEALYCVRNGYRPRHRFDPYSWLGPLRRSVRRKFADAAMPTPLWLTRFGRELYWRENIRAFRHRRFELV